MTLLEMSALYAESAAALRRRIGELQRELAALTAHYYDRSYHRHERYTL